MCVHYLFWEKCASVSVYTHCSVHHRWVGIRIFGQIFTFWEITNISKRTYLGGSPARSKIPTKSNISPLEWHRHTHKYTNTTHTKIYIYFIFTQRKPHSSLHICNNRGLYWVNNHIDHTGNEKVCAYVDLFILITFWCACSAICWRTLDLLFIAILSSISESTAYWLT